MTGNPSIPRFARRFGIIYTPRLTCPKSLPKHFLKACAAFKQRGLDRSRLPEYLEELSAGRVVPLAIKKIDDQVGFGLFAKSALRPGDWIGEYAGVLSRDWGTRFNPYLFKYPFATPFAIDGERLGNELRFANHSPRRCNARRAYLLHDGILHAAFLAAEEIPKGAQILIDYGTGYWHGRMPAELRP